MHAKSALISAVLILGGCAADPQFRGEHLTPQNSATIRGIGGTTGNFLASVLVPIGMQKEVLIFKVDGVKVNTWGSTNLVRVEAGKHLLAVTCRFKVDGMSSYGHEEFTVEVKPGRTYQLDAEPKCYPLIQDITDAPVGQIESTKGPRS
ncbi:MAG: hypothetical protein ACYC42_09250 [Lysobacter sp.]